MLTGFRRYRPLILPLLLVSTAFCQQPAAGSLSTSGRIELNVVVTGKAGGDPIANLPQQDFTLLDNKVARPLEGFHAVASDQQQPTQVILLLDAVNISYQNLAYERDEISKFLRADGGKLVLPTTLAIFKDTGTQVQQGVSRDGNALSEDLNKYVIGLRDIRRSSGVYGAGERLQLSISTLQRLAEQEAAVPGRKLILWVSPGWPLLSGPGIQLSSADQQRLFSTIVALSTKLRQANITLYSVDSLGVAEPLERVDYYQQFTKGVAKPKQTFIGNLGLQVLAVQSGGLALNSSDVPASLSKCIADTAAYYQITFDTQRADQPDEYHHLEIRLGKPDLVARTRDGYYAQP
jgi:VWFA-related protein